MAHKVKRGGTALKRPPVLGGTLKARRSPMPRERMGHGPSKGSGPKTGDTTRTLGEGAIMNGGTTKPSMARASLKKALRDGNTQASTSGGKVPGPPRAEKPGGPRVV